jgi:hypothetical protein
MSRSVFSILLTKTNWQITDGESYMEIKKIIQALIVGGLIATTALEWRRIRDTQRRARSILYPGNPREMAAVLAELKRYRDRESQTLARQLEDHLRRRDRRLWRRSWTV